MVPSKIFEDTAYVTSTPTVSMCEFLTELGQMRGKSLLISFGVLHTTSTLSETTAPCFLLVVSTNGSHFVLGSCAGLAKEGLHLLHFLFFKGKKNPSEYM